MEASSHLKKMLESFSKKLEEQSKPVPNDDRRARYCEYITRFSSYFSRERWYLTGSTVTRMRLRSLTDEGDYDYLIISGISIPKDALEHRNDVPCFVHIRTDKVKTFVFDEDLKVDGKYLHSKVLKELDKRAFEITSGLLPVLMSPVASQSYIGLNQNINPGTSQVNYFGANLNGDFELAVQSTDLSSTVKEHLCNLSGVLGGVNSENTMMPCLLRMLATLIKEAVLSENISPPSPKKVCRRDSIESTLRFDFKSSKDFIAAFLIDGTLQCMDEWKKNMMNRKKAFWPKEDTIDKIYASEVYVVAKPAIVSPDLPRDFCFGFNQAERLLAESLSPDQRMCMLLLKSLQKGFLGEYSDVLTTFHWSTAFYHKCEETDPALFHRETMLQALGSVLSYMCDCLRSRYLKHYFVESNLIAHISPEKADKIAAKIKQIIRDPESALPVYFEKGVCTRNMTVSDEDLLKRSEEPDAGCQVTKVLELWVQLQRAASAEDSKLTRALLDTFLLILQKEMGFLENETLSMEAIVNSLVTQGVRYVASTICSFLAETSSK